VPCNVYYSRFTAFVTTILAFVTKHLGHAGFCNEKPSALQIGRLQVLSVTIARFPDRISAQTVTVCNVWWLRVRSLSGWPRNAETLRQFVVSHGLGNEQRRVLGQVGYSGFV